VGAACAVPQMADLIVQGPSYSSMCSHQVTTFVKDPDYYEPGSDESDLQFRRYLADSGAATGIVKALVEMLEDEPAGGAGGAEQLAESLSGWCKPKATGGGLVRGEVVVDEDALLAENEALKARLAELTQSFEAATTTLVERIPGTTLLLSSISASGVPAGDDEAKPDLFLRITASDSGKVIEGPPPIETEPVANSAAPAWESVQHLELPAGLASSAVALLIQLWDADEMIASAELPQLPPDPTGSATLTLPAHAANVSRAPDGETLLIEGSVELTFEYSVKPLMID